MQFDELQAFLRSLVGKSDSSFLSVIDHPRILNLAIQVLLQVSTNITNTALGKEFDSITAQAICLLVGDLLAHPSHASILFKDSQLNKLITHLLLHCNRAITRQEVFTKLHILATYLIVPKEVALPATPNRILIQEMLVWFKFN